MPLNDDFLLTQITIDLVDGPRTGAILFMHPDDRKARGLDVYFQNVTETPDMSDATVMLYWQHDTAKALRGLEPFEAVDATIGHFKVYYPSDMGQSAGTVSAKIVVVEGDREVDDSRNINIPLPKISVDGLQSDPSATPSQDNFSVLGELLDAYRNGLGEITDYTTKAQAAADRANDSADKADTATGKANAAVDAANQALSDAEGAVSEANAATSNATEAAAAANKAAEGANQATQTANDEEAKRQEAERLRVQSENARETNEDERESHEDGRVADETTRKANEDARVKAEGQRVAAEEKRGTDFTESQNANKQAFDAAQDERTQAFDASEKSRQDAFDAAEEKREAGEKERSDAEALREDAERKRAEKATADAMAEAARVEAEKARVEAEKLRVAADGDRSTRQAANDTQQAKNNADQAANNKAAQGLVWVDLTEEQLDPETRTPNFDGEFGKLYFAPAKNPTETDAATEWMWKPTGTGGRWEHVGTSETILPAGIGQEKVQQIHDGEQLSGNGIMYEADLAVYQALLNQDHAGHAKAQKATDDAQDAEIKSVKASVTAAEAKAASDLADAVQSQAATDEAQDTEIAAAKAAVGPAIANAKSDLQTWVQETAKANGAKVADALGQASVGSTTNPIYLDAGAPKACNPYPELGPYATKAYCDGAIDEAIGKAMEASY